MQLSRKQLKEALKTMPLDTVISGNRELTPKQKKFTRLIVNEELSGAEAYRQAYNSKGKPKTTAGEAIRLKKNPSIAQEIEALKLAKEAQQDRFL